MKIEATSSKRQFVLTVDEETVARVVGILDIVYSLPDDLLELYTELREAHGVQCLGEVYMDEDGDVAYRERD